MNEQVTVKSPAERKAFRRGAGVAAGAVMLAGSLVGWTVADSSAMDAFTSAPAAIVADTTVSPVIGAPNASYAPIVERLAPAVVTVRSERRARAVSQQMPNDPLLREFFGRQFGGQQPQFRTPPQAGLGSGVIVRADGYILTNDHVVDGADKVTVDLTDGRSFEAKVVGTDAPSDLAVLKVDADKLPTVPLGNSDAVRVGDVVLAMGNPLGIGQTVTMGIVSAKGRATGGAGDGDFQDFIQTDAPINQGNSGGALVSSRGELIGINSQILSTSGGNIGIGFAIPANMARNVMTQLIEHGKVSRGMLGVTIQPVTSEIARSLGLSRVAGALVSAVQPGSPAEKGGVERGDVITAIDGKEARDGNTLRNQIAQLPPGRDVNLTVLRDGKERTIGVTLAELRSPNTESRGGDAESGSAGYGLSVEPLTPDVARQLGVSGSAGVVVTGVQESGRAAEAGLRRGDVITDVDGKAVTNADQLRSALKSGDRPALLLVFRGGTSLFVPLDRAQK